MLHKLLESNNMCDTPVRHDDLTIAKTSLRSRMLIGNNRGTAKLKRISSNIVVEKKEYNVREVMLSTETNCPLDTGTSHKDGVNLNEDGSFAMKVDEISTALETPCEDSNIFRTSNANMEVSMAKNQEHSTPTVLSHSRAASSTPNQEILNSTKLTRNVSTQTAFTLCARDFSELNDEIKSYLSEEVVKQNKHITSLNGKQPFNKSNETTSPLRSLCTSKIINYDLTPVQCRQATRKLSLRSKTMICSAIESSKDKPETFMRYKSIEEKRLFSNTFSMMPHHKTPPAYTEKVFHNPFEVDLPERLGKSVFSPNVFDNVASPSEGSEYLRWTIEDISSINPASIEEDFTLPTDDEDPEKEFQVQQEIDRYFSETHIVLSPYDSYKSSDVSEAKDERVYVKAAASTPQKVFTKICKELKCADSQTSLTLPEVLPDRLEESLKCYFKFFEVDELNLSVSNLRRKLFFHSEDEPPSPVRFESSPSPVTKSSLKTEYSPYANNKAGRHFTPLTQQEAVSSPELSPVVSDTVNTRVKNSSISSCKKPLHLYFSGDDLSIIDVKNSAYGEDQNEMMDCCEGQDTGYHTEESCLGKLHSIMASTPTHLLQ